MQEMSEQRLRAGGLADLVTWSGLNSHRMLASCSTAYLTTVASLETRLHFPGSLTCVGTFCVLVLCLP